MPICPNALEPPLLIFLSLSPIDMIPRDSNVAASILVDWERKCTPSPSPRESPTDKVLDQPVSDRVHCNPFSHAAGESSRKLHIHHHITSSYCHPSFHYFEQNDLRRTCSSSTDRSAKPAQGKVGQWSTCPCSVYQTRQQYRDSRICRCSGVRLYSHRLGTFTFRP